MAIVATAVAALTTHNRKVWDVTCLDADTGPTAFAHGFGATPGLVFFTQHVTVAAAANVADWSATWDGVNITLSKLGGVGTGGAVPGTTVVLRVYAERPAMVNA